MKHFNKKYQIAVVILLAVLFIFGFKVFNSNAAIRLNWQCDKNCQSAAGKTAIERIGNDPKTTYGIKATGSEIIRSINFQSPIRDIASSTWWSIFGGVCWLDNKWTHGVDVCNGVDKNTKIGLIGPVNKSKRDLTPQWETYRTTEGKLSTDNSWLFYGRGDPVPHLVMNTTVSSAANPINGTWKAAYYNDGYSRSSGSWTVTPASVLTVNNDGSGSGNVVSDPTGINCGSRGSKCSAIYEPPPALSTFLVKLTATADNGSYFAGWSGNDVSSDCTTSTCTIIMDKDKTVTAEFKISPGSEPRYNLTITKAGTGAGKITSISTPGQLKQINCGNDDNGGNVCLMDYNSGTSVTLTASADSDSIFAGWSGNGAPSNCTGPSAPLTCNVSMTGNKDITATFNKPSYNIVPSDPPPVKINQTTIFRGKYDPDGSNGGAAEQDTTISATWVSSDPTIATVTSAVPNPALAKCLTVGSVTITSVYNNITANATLNCELPDSYTLTVIKAGAGVGIIGDTVDYEINCGDPSLFGNDSIFGERVCSAGYPANASVDLVPVYIDIDGGSTFAGFSGCDSTSTLPGTSVEQCHITMKANRTVTGTFNLTPTYVISPASTSTLVGQTKQFTGWYDLDGPGSQPQQNKTSSATWSSSDTNIATVNSGLAKCVSVGSVTISSAYEGFPNPPAIASLTCSAPGATTVSGHVKDSSSVVMSGVDVMAFWGCGGGPVPPPVTASTDSSGYYTLTIPSNWISICEYAIVSASKSSYTFTPTSPNVTLVKSGNVNQNFTGSYSASTYTLTVSKTPNASWGTIVSNPTGINCGISCASQYYDYYTSGTFVALTATPSSGYAFSDWLGCDSVSGTLPNQICNVTMSSNKTVTATFGVVTTNQAPIAVAKISKDGSNYYDSITVTKGATTNIYLSAESSSDPNGWTNPDYGVSQGGDCAWNRDLKQGTFTFKPPQINNPASPSDCTIVRSFIFNDDLGGQSSKTITYEVLKITDKGNAASNVASVSVTVQAPGATTVSGHVKDSSNVAMAGVDVTASWGCSAGLAAPSIFTSTNSSGDYTVTIPNNWTSVCLSAIVSASKSSCTFSPNSPNVALVKGGNVNQNFSGSCGGVSTHKACVNYACVSVSGPGSDLCVNDAQCGGGGGHKECKNNACVAVTGAGSDLCSNDTQCVSCPSLNCSSYISNPSQPIIIPHPSALISGSPNPAEIQNEIDGYNNVAKYIVDWISSDTGACSSCLVTGANSFSTSTFNASQTFYKPRGNYKYDINCSAGHYCSDHQGNQSPVPSVSSTITISVVQLPQCTFWPDSSAIILPKSTNLNWKCYYADSCSINQGIGSVSLALNANGSKSGSKQVRPTSNTTYTLTCSGLDGSRSYQTTISIGFIPWLREILPR